MHPGYYRTKSHSKSENVRTRSVSPVTFGPRAPLHTGLVPRPVPHRQPRRRQAQANEIPGQLAGIDLSRSGVRAGL